MSSTITSLTRQTRTASRTSSATEAVCTWEGHCLGDTCSNENDCDNDWVCANTTCQTCCISKSEPTFFSTFSASDLTTITSPSSITTSATTPTSSSATSAPTNTSSGGLNTGAAVGIGIGGAALLIICIVGGWWFFMRRKNANQAYELGAVAPPSYDDDRKELYQATAQAQELPTRHPPVELHAIELAELEDSNTGRPNNEGKAMT
ncbi:hypothetical protein DPSP01_009342 [Paraphaeosphaeria sporulosa]|uniref:Mid2 domain-containing protein n=1 Tax=Paraphaeosphaeria sporulosa TaxID=1460663 RepID=A0A177CJL9_9PLEO|nr:uncharacterized protein CC84DRAFT_1163844 [Paraphaeosphaeria sporulosa]OAG07734.1 hypothetical protein CC84DRAFT_1163844 [Paraphaeosphaeria sporulosa]